MITDGVAFDLLAAKPDAAGMQWVHLVPKGRFKGVDGRGPWHAPDLARIITASRRAASGRPLAVDYDHQIDLAPATGGRAPAAGWINQLEARPDGIWGLIEWTPSARDALAAREYRFISPVFAADDDQNVTRLVRAALTNNPNLKELAALNSAMKDGGLSATLTNSAMTMETIIGALQQELSLPPECDLDDILQAVREIVARRMDEGTNTNSAVDPAQYVPIAMFRQAVAAANRANAGLSRNAAEAAVSQAIGQRLMLEWMREWAVNLCMSNKPAFDDFVAGVGKPISGFLARIDQPEFPGRAWNAHPDAPEQHEANAVFERLGLSADDMKTYGAIKR